MQKKGQPDIYRLEVLSDTPKTTQQHFNDYSDWTVKEERPFTQNELNAVSSATIVPSQYGRCVCLILNSGGKSFIPLSSDASAGIGETIDMSKAKLRTLSKHGQNDIHMLFI